MVYGKTKEDASAKVQALAFRVLAEDSSIKKHPQVPISFNAA